MKFTSVLGLVSLLAAAGCHTPREAAPPAAAASSAPAPATQASARAEPPASNPARPAVVGPDAAPVPEGVDASAMDWAADPCQDFFQFSCGAWVKRTEIPAYRSSWFLYSAMEEDTELQLNKLLQETAAGKAPKGSAYAKQLGDYYATCIDEKALETSLPELQKALKRIDGIQDGQGVVAAITAMQKDGQAPLFSFGSQQDFGDATQMVAGFDQGGLGLPDRDYYLDEDAKKQEVRALYDQHLRNVFGLLGETPENAAKKAKEIEGLEKSLAQASLDLVSRRDPQKLFHRMTRADLAKQAPEFPWSTFLDALKVSKSAKLNVSHPPFFVAAAKLVKETPVSTWKSYLTLQTVSSAVPALPKRFQDEYFAFQSKTFTGAKEDRARWKKCVGWTDHWLGEALARPFVAKVFAGDSKKRSKEMVAAVEAAFAENLKGLSWMDDATKKKALEKLHTVNNKVGFPDKWKRYDGLQTDRKSFLGNYLRSVAYESERDAKKIGKPVDRTVWDMTPPTVNAYYNPSLNEIVLPAGILRPPLFSKDFSPAANFGSTGGGTVGHELTHGFDDEGRQFDAKGNLRDWWSENSAKSFSERANCVADQFSAYTVLDGIHLNGKLTTGENVADLGGVKLAYRALQTYLKAHPSTPVAPSRLSREQAYFTAYGQSWCAKTRPEQVRLRAATDPHAPPEWRVNGPLSNLKAFQEAFQCRAGDRMVSARPCEVW